MDFDKERMLTEIKLGDGRFADPGRSPSCHQCKKMVGSAKVQEVSHDPEDGMCVTLYCHGAAEIYMVDEIDVTNPNFVGTVPIIVFKDEARLNRVFDLRVRRSRSQAFWDELDKS